MNQTLNLISSAMEKYGYDVSTPIIDGKIHRFHIGGRKNNNGWYCFFDDKFVAGVFGDWVSGEKITWCEKSEKELTYEEKVELANRKERIKDEHKRSSESAAKKAKDIYSNLPIADKDHKYLLKKRIPGSFARINEKGTLVIPIYATGTSNIQSLQFITDSGEKLFLTGGKIKNGSIAIGNVTDTILVCEGYATASSLNQATGFMAVAAFTSNNLKIVSSTLRQIHKHKKIIICCDNDQFTQGNPGLTKGQEAATNIGASISVPVFKDISSKPTDFNDLMILEGNDEVDRQVRKSISIQKNDSKSKISIDNVFTPEKMIDSYLNYIKTLKDNRFLTGIDEIDKRIRGVSGGEVLTIIARAGSFKTAMLQNMLLRYTSNSAWGAVFFSLEMPVSNVTERYLGITLDYECGEAERCFISAVSNQNSESVFVESIKKEFCSRMDRIFVVPVKVSLEDAKQYVRLIEENYNIKIGVIGIDYMGLLDCNGKNEYETISSIARETKETAKELNIPVVVLSQVSRKGGDGEEEISLDMGRGSGAIEEGADFVLGLWQHERMDSLGNKLGEYDLICRILKNRKGSKGSKWCLTIEPDRFRFGNESTEYVQQDKPNRKSRVKI